MDKINDIFVNFWWHNPYLIALFSSVLTGIIITLTIYLKRLMGKKDVLASLTSELAGNYNSLKKIQDLSKFNGLNKNDGMIAAIRKDMPWNKDLTDEKIALDYIKNMPVGQELSIDCWIKLQSQLAKYSKDYPKYEEIYGILKLIIRFSKIKSGDISNINNMEKAVINQFGAIRSNSTEFIKNYEENFLKK